MSHLKRSACAVALTSVAASFAVAQPQHSAPEASNPASATGAPAMAASTLAGGYRSAFEGYRGFKEQPVGNWRQANDLVRQIGGWQAYAREAQGGDTTAPPMTGDHVAMPAPSGAGTPAPLSPAASSPGVSPAPVKAPPARPAGGHSGHR